MSLSAANLRPENDAGLELGASTIGWSALQTSNGSIRSKFDHIGIGTANSNAFVLRSNGTDRWDIRVSGDFVPIIAGTYDIGSATLDVGNIYTRVINSPLGSLDFYTNNTFQLRMNTAGKLIFQVSNGDICQGTSDGADNRRLRFGGGGDVSDTRGAYVDINGNEHASFPGDLRLFAGNVSGGAIDFFTGGSSSWQINDSGHFIPGTSGSVDVAAVSKPAVNVYTGDVLSNC